MKTITSLLIVCSSVLMAAENCSGVLGIGSAPCLASASRTSNRASAPTISPFSFAMISRGVPAGARIPVQSVVS